MIFETTEILFRNILISLKLSFIIFSDVAIIGSKIGKWPNSDHTIYLFLNKVSQKYYIKISIRRKISIAVRIRSHYKIMF